MNVLNELNDFNGLNILNDLNALLLRGEKGFVMRNPLNAEPFVTFVSFVVNIPGSSPLRTLALWNTGLQFHRASVSVV